VAQLKSIMQQSGERAKTFFNRGFRLWELCQSDMSEREFCEIMAKRVHSTVHPELGEKGAPRYSSTLLSRVHPLWHFPFNGVCNSSPILNRGRFGGRSFALPTFSQWSFQHFANMASPWDQFFSGKTFPCPSPPHRRPQVLLLLRIRMPNPGCRIQPENPSRIPPSSADHFAFDDGRGSSGHEPLPRPNPIQSI